MLVPQQHAPGKQKPQLAHERKSQRDEDDDSHKNGIGKHTNSDLPDKLR